ncbi:hypothetical protein [Williamsia phyllosphaerae]|uniref:hypothetical protein n=1 Tax=Williamsia phyllosphaerae TaxID=885042 RepID=UPI0016644F5F|nr:hypothetical protein [Williamsia phyllosphaerae]
MEAARGALSSPSAAESVAVTGPDTTHPSRAPSPASTPTPTVNHRVVADAE